MSKAKKKISYDLYGKLQISTIEREVEDAWNGGISLFFSDSPIEHPYGCDGYLSEGLMLRLIIEYKFDEKLSVAIARARVLVQVLFYLKRFEEGNLQLPNVIMVADRNECFVIHTNDVQQYLDEKVDWSKAPSSAADLNPDFVAKIACDSNINPFIFVVGSDFDLKAVVDRIRDLAVNVKRYVRVTEHNIAQIFEYYTGNVLREPNKLSAHELVESFMGVLLDPMEYYQHPKNKNILVTKTGKLPIYGDAYLSFFDFYNQNYTPQEKMKFTEIADRLIEDVTRRRNGEFFTPTPFVDYAHRMMEHEFGDDWKEQYVVWDCCCGTKNLTRDYRFRELYCSTLNEEDLRLSERYNQEAVSFVFDFLNDDIDQLPKGLINSMKAGKPLCFILNPPYATSATFTADKQKEDGCCDNAVAERMRQEGLDLACRNMVPQFLHRIGEFVIQFSLSDVKIGLFCKPNFLCANSFDKFRDYWFDKFQYLKGIYFNASEFADVSNKWGIAFELWQSGKQLERSFFPHCVVENNSGKIVTLFDKTIYNKDNTKDSSEWIREIPISSVKKEMPVLTSGIYQYRNPNNKSIGKLSEDAIGCYHHVASDVYHSAAYVALFSANCSHPSGKWSITKDNFGRIASVFASRKLIANCWYNDKDIFLAPEDTNSLYNSFQSDSLVYSLFHSSSQQSSLRNVSYRDSIWSIKNEFFWMSRDRILKLANEFGNMDCYSDARTDSDRFLFSLLGSTVISDEAQAVLQKASEIVEKTFKYRELFNEEHPEYQINNWDCGWCQIRALATIYAKDDLFQFRSLFRTLSDKMAPMVFKLGFLK